jgi:polysaccharide biosynthesis transport protein
MVTSFDADKFLRHIRHNWYLTPMICGVAVIIAAGVSLLMPRKYTATARILIEPPAGSDQRTFVAVSPIYLESLKTYEHLASGDSLFLRALEQFHLRGHGDTRAVESWKRSVLRVEIPRNTKVLEISATLADPKMAQALAFYLAGETVKLSREVSRRSGEELAAEAETQFQDARKHLERAEAAWSSNEERQPVEGLEERVGSAAALRDEAARNLMAAEMLLAEDAERQKLIAAAPGSRSELEGVHAELQLTQARASMLRERMSALDRETSRLQAILAERNARREALLTQRKAAEAASTAAEAHLREVRGAVGYTGERLNIVDPGIVPERPSSPNTPLNVIAAFLLGLIASLLYTLLGFSMRRELREVRRYRVAQDV